MRACLAVLSVLFLAAFFYGCSRDQNPGTDNALDPGAAMAPVDPAQGLPELYTVGWTNTPYTYVRKINLLTGLGSDGAALDFSGFNYPIVTPFGFAFDLDGTMYAFVSWGDGTPEAAGSQLVRVDMQTGALTPIGEPWNINLAGPDIDACGNLYVTGFTEGPPETPGVYYLWGNTNLYRVDKYTGERTIVGDTGRFDWMDLAFDSQGRLWATTDNKMFELDPNTGAQLRELPIYGVPQSNIPGCCPEDWPYMEVMTIAFDEKDNLYAGAMKGFSWCLDTNEPVMKIEIVGDEAYATLIGYTNMVYNHGGDIMPEHVNIMHRKLNGSYVPLRISMSALQTHLAHGDYVPGTDGHPCPVPGLRGERPPTQ